MQTGTFNAGSGRYAPATFETRGDKEYIVCLLARASGGEPDKSPRPWASVFGAERAYYLPMYNAWKANEEAPINGLPLTDWPPMAAFARLLEPLKRISVRSVEDLAGLAEGNAQNIGPGTLNLIEKARDWLKSRHNITDVLEQNRELHTANQLLAEQNRLLKLENERLGPPRGATLSAEEVVALVPKRGPGRPRKDKGADGQAMTG